MKVKKIQKTWYINNIVKPGNMKDIENLKIYKDLGKKLRIKNKIINLNIEER